MKQMPQRQIVAALLAGLAWYWPLGQVAEAQETAVEGGNWSIEGGVDLPSAFFYRGYRLLERGAMIQPYVTVSRVAWASGSVALEPYAGVWNNLTQDEGTRSPTHYNEVNPYVGINVTAGSLTATVDFNYYHSPSAYFEDASEVGLIVGMEHPLAPQIGVYREIGGRQDTYAVASVTPWWDVPRTRIGLSFPVSVGVSFNGYYADSAGANRPFGYASGGATLGYALTEHLSFEAGAEVLHLAAPSAQDSNGGARRATVARLGLLFAY